MVYQWSVSDSKSPQISRTLFSIQADLNNTLVSMASARPWISNSFSHLFKPFRIVLSAPVTIVITVNFMFRWNGKFHYSAGSIFFFFLLSICNSDLRNGIRLTVCTTKSQRILCVSFSWTDSRLCIYELLVL